MTKIIFLHIPKTAGNTFRKHILDRVFFENEKFHIRGNIKIEDFLRLSEERKHNLLLLTGHVPYGFHKYLSDNAKYITFVRDPVERIISHYYYAKRFEGHELHNSIIENKLTLEEYALSDLSKELDNGQTRQLGGCDVPINMVDENCFEMAKENIYENIEVGITEKFDKSITYLKYKFKWDISIYYCKENVTKKKQKNSIEKSVIEKIKKRNLYDLLLYEYCIKILDNRIKEEAIPKYIFYAFKVINFLYSNIVCKLSNFFNWTIRKVKKHISIK